MITLTRGERCRTPFRRDPRPSKTHGGPPWPPDHTPRVPVPWVPAGPAERNPNEPTKHAGERNFYYRPQHAQKWAYFTLIAS